MWLRCCCRLRELRCVDLRDSFSLTDEALSTLGLLPRLERVALGLTAGARGCCRLTCRALKALFAPQQKLQKQQQQHENAIAPIKFLSLARCSEMKDFSVLANAAKSLVRSPFSCYYCFCSVVAFPTGGSASV